MVSIGEETYRVLCKLLMVAMIGWQDGSHYATDPTKRERVLILDSINLDKTGRMHVPDNIISKFFKILFL